MRNKPPNFKTQCNCSIDVELLKLSYQNKVTPSNALEFGLTFKLAELGLLEFPENNLSEKITNLVNEIQKLNKKIGDLECPNRNQEKTPSV